MDNTSANIKIEGGQLTVAVNPKLYPLEAVYSAAYVFMDRAYIVLDGDPEKEILVNMKLKSGGSLEEIGNEFNNELLHYSDYLIRASETKNAREMILQRAILTNDSSLGNDEPGDDADFENIEDSDEDSDDDYLDDPEGIAIPWEEKYGDNKEECAEEKNEDTSKQ